ncbi:MAG: sugar ABC transporter substrate-binding protein [Actinomycetota bacterium]|nr:sugar ABC transporter substrate-binding protein [Actinomycetota bacterium]
MRRLFVVLVSVVALVMAACDGDGEQQAQENGEAAAQEDGLSFAVVVHDEPAGTFWGVVKNGAEQAAEDLGASVTVQGSGEPQEQADMVEAAIAQDVDGIAVSLANPDAMRGPLQSAAEQGIPVVTLNSGLNDWQDLGAITHVGQDEIIAGNGAGQRLNEAGVTKVLCAIHEVGNVALDERCSGVEETFEGEVVREQIDINDPVASQSTINSALESDPDIDGVMTLNPDMATTAALPAIQEVGRDISLATFDLGTEVLQGIMDGDILFAIDQQQYMQGYLPIVFLTLNVENLNTAGGGQPVLTGPGFVTEENAEQVLELTEQGTR